MDVVVTTESRFYTAPDGRWVCADGTYGSHFWQRYLDVFDRVWIVARCSREVRQGGVPVEAEGLRVWPLDNAHGAWGAVQHWRTWQRQIAPLLSPHRAYILRLPGQIGGVLGPILQRHSLKWGVEAVGDPATAFGRGGCTHPLRPGLRAYFRHAMRHSCRNASAVAYVTSQYLQRAYPANERAFTTHYSSVEMPESAYVDQPRDYVRRPVPLHLIHVGTMSQPYKGQHDLIEAVSACRRSGRAVQLALVGDGRLRDALEHQVRQRRLEDCVRFLGQLSAGAAVRHAMDQADLFVLPSYQEGLPRVLIEAQARSLPCVATDVGGIPEMLGRHECVPPGRPSQLATLIMSILDDPRRMTQLSSENLQRARRFSNSILRQRRAVFYEQLRSTVDGRRERWIGKAA